MVQYLTVSGRRRVLIRCVKQQGKQLIKQLASRRFKTVLNQPAHTRQTKVALENRINLRLAYSSFEDKCDVSFLQ